MQAFFRDFERKTGKNSAPGEQERSKLRLHRGSTQLVDGLSDYFTVSGQSSDCMMIAGENSSGSAWAQFW